MIMPCCSGDMRQDRRLQDEDDELLQFAIQQSLVVAGTEDEQVSSVRKTEMRNKTFLHFLKKNDISYNE